MKSDIVLRLRMAETHLEIGNVLCGEAADEIDYLRRALAELILQVEEDVPADSATEHLWEAVETAKEALGYYVEEE